MMSLRPASLFVPAELSLACKGLRLNSFIGQAAPHQRVGGVGLALLLFVLNLGDSYAIRSS